MIVYAAGVFDVIHTGHLNLLKRAKDLGDTLIVGVLSDEAASTYKPAPVMPFGQRIRLTQALEWVDMAIPQEDTDATYLLKQIKPDILVHGDDHTPDWEIGQTWIEENGGEYVMLPYTKGVSSSQIKEEIGKI